MRYHEILSERGPGPAISPAFSAWFGRSRIVDASGAPLRMYHGTGHDIDAFEADRASPTALYGPGFYFTDAPQVAGGLGDADPSNEDMINVRADFNMVGYAFGGRKYQYPELTKKQMAHAKRLFGSKTVQQDAYNDIGTRQTYRGGWLAWQAGEPEFREWLAQSAPRWFRERIMKAEPTRTTRPQVIPVYLSIQHPFDIRAPLDHATVDRIAARLSPDEAKHLRAHLADAERRGHGAAMTNDDLYQALTRCSNGYTQDKVRANAVLHAAGYDGIVHEGGQVIGTMGAHFVAVAFRPEQIKSAIGNRGSYDPSNPRLTETG